jgi:DNA polymerase-3 subunit epsilon
VEYSRIPREGGFHRALYDSEMTAKVWMALLENIGERYKAFDLSFEQIKKLAKTPKKSVDKLLTSWGQ